MNARALFFILAAAALLAPRARGDSTAELPGAGFDTGRYTVLWTKSPFAIATPDAPPTSEDYELVGMAQFDGVSYVSLIDKQNQDHFILSSDKPVKNLKLVSISHGSDGASAVILRNGESLTLREVKAPASPTGAAPPAFPTALPFGMRPSSNPSVGGMAPVYRPPRARFHRIIHIPPPPR